MPPPTHSSSKELEPDFYQLDFLGAVQSGDVSLRTSGQSNRRRGPGFLCVEYFYVYLHEQLRSTIKFMLSGACTREVLPGLQLHLSI